MPIFHIVNRGVEKRAIVKNDADRFRFVHSLFVFNDRFYVDENHRRPGWRKSGTERAPLVEMHAWCLMDNHYHLLLSPVEEDMKNISLFMKKLNMGYAKYFNEKYERNGALWQGKYKKVEVARDAHFLYLPYYIHLNPLDIVGFATWREGTIQNTQKALDALERYRWSSFSDYMGSKNFSSVITKQTLEPVLGSPATQKKEIKKLLQKGREWNIPSITQ